MQKQILPSWRAVLPLLLHSVHMQGADSPGGRELARLAAFADEWNDTAPALLEMLAEARDCIMDEEPAAALENIMRARLLVEGDE
jgi:hypothetical protein